MPAPSTLGYTPGRIVDALRSASVDPRALLEGIGAYLQARAQEAFVKQRRGSVKWRPRRVPNVAGIVADLRAGKNPPMRRLDPRPALVDTGRLKMSIQSRVTGRNRVEVGTNLPYASLHQFGGESSQPVTQTVKDALAKLLTRAPWNQYEADLYWLLDKDVTELSTNVPARPFVMWTREDAKDITKMVYAAYTGRSIKSVLISRTAA